MKHLFLKAAGGLLYILAAVSALIFLPAWTLRYWQAWTFLGIFMASISAIFIYLAKCDPELLARRVKTNEKKNSQRVIRLLINFAFTVTIAGSALDHRCSLSAVPPQVVFLGDALVLLGMLIIFWVFKENTFTAQTVEVEAQQAVVSSGPYSLVRHPMYVGGLVFMSGIPLALGSWWGLLAVGPFTLVIAWRIVDEEKLLTDELQGYAAYRKTVRYRLIPFVW
jgi:protein-S-isoprenylcysteine O-methyltransferase Ste14